MTEKYKKRIEKLKKKSKCSICKKVSDDLVECENCGNFVCENCCGYVKTDFKLIPCCNNCEKVTFFDIIGFFFMGCILSPLILAENLLFHSYIEVVLGDLKTYPKNESSKFIKFENELMKVIEFYPDKIDYFTEISKSPSKLMEKRETFKEFLFIIDQYSKDLGLKKDKRDISKSINETIDILWSFYVGVYNNKNNLPAPIFNKDGSYENVFFEND